MGIAAQKAVKLFRISYRTQRLAGQADFATALVALPARRELANKQGMPEQDDEEEDKMKDGKRAPLVVFAHGTAPYGTACASSKLDPLQCSNTTDGDTELVSIVALATLGYPVIAPDYAGYVQGSRAPGYLLSEDEAHSVLDATRAMNKLRQRAVEKVVLIGHSQGGHAVLSAQSLAKSYGLAGQLVGVAAMAAFWAPTRALGVIGLPGSPFEEDPNALSFIIEYFYTHGEVLDGAGKGKQVFDPDPTKQMLLAQHINTCNFNSTTCNFINAPPPELGRAYEFLKPDFFDAIAACGLNVDDCQVTPAGQTWEKRFKADRPKVDKKGAPIVLWHGAADPVVPVPFASCAYNKIASDVSGGTTPFTFCGDQTANHDQILSNDLAWVTRWIDARALGGAEPEACMSYPDFAEYIGPDIACPEPPSPVNVD
jgi:pimeloyl-ACP methyl ester carboxylesterase